VPVAGKPTPIDITEQMRSACESILPPVTETMLDLLSHVEPEYQEKVRNNIILSGGSSLIRGLAEALQHSLADVGGGRVRTVEDPVFAGSNGGLALAIDADEADWEQLTT
jgi:rod shape-determining protein MreB